MRRVDVTDEKTRRLQKRRRGKHVREQLKLAAQIVCESHKPDPKVMERMLTYLLELLPTRMNDDRRRAFGDVLKRCAIGEPVVRIDESQEHALEIDGFFDVGELSKFVVWTDAGSKIGD